MEITSSKTVIINGNYLNYISRRMNIHSGIGTWVEAVIAVSRSLFIGVPLDPYCLIAFTASILMGRTVMKL